ncbi:hypothetical protein I2W78_00615 [Streptomyces spinoverrucosus]|nr:hypothetical protein [Streptomyces spinoverrucosus]MBG0850405.1 hypothetical protein [Streptomyces spinoverrucosus]
MDFTEAAVHAGRRAEARAHIAAARTAGLDVTSPRLKMLLLASTALAAEGPQSGGWFDLARIHFYPGEHLRRAKATTQARHHLAPAVDTFQQLGAMPWARRATQEPRATGAHRESDSGATGFPLTPQQRDIAELAARQGVLGVRKKYRDERLEAACAKATLVDNPSYRTIKRVLVAGTETEPPPETAGNGEPPPPSCTAPRGSSRPPRPPRPPT